MRILGIDPGSYKTGFGLIDHQANKSRYCHSGFFDLGKKNPLPQRLLLLSQELSGILKTYQPQAVSIEKIFFAKNAQSALVLGHARGVILQKLAEAEIPIYEYSPTEIKQSLVGVGRAAKDQVEYMVRVLLNQSQKPMNPDEADALAIAITHAHQHRLPPGSIQSQLQQKAHS